MIRQQVIGWVKIIILLNYLCKLGRRHYLGGEMKKYTSLHFVAWFILFVIMPAVYVEKYLLDYESAPRFILLSLLCLVSSATFLLGKNQTGFNFTREPYFITAGIFLILAALQILQALNPGEAIREWIRFALMFFLVLILYYLIRQKPEFR